MDRKIQRLEERSYTEPALAMPVPLSRPNPDEPIDWTPIARAMSSENHKFICDWEI